MRKFAFFLLLLQMCGLGSLLAAGDPPKVLLDNFDQLGLVVQDLIDEALYAKLSGRHANNLGQVSELRATRYSQATDNSQIRNGNPVEIRRHFFWGKWGTLAGAATGYAIGYANHTPNEGFFYGAAGGALLPYFAQMGMIEPIQHRQWEVKLRNYILAAGVERLREWGLEIPNLDQVAWFEEFLLAESADTIAWRNPTEILAELARLNLVVNQLISESGACPSQHRETLAKVMSEVYAATTAQLRRKVGVRPISSIGAARLAGAKISKGKRQLLSLMESLQFSDLETHRAEVIGELQEEHWQYLRFPRYRHVDRLRRVRLQTKWNGWAPEYISLANDLNSLHYIPPAVRELLPYSRSLGESLEVAPELEVESQPTPNNRVGVALLNLKIVYSKDPGGEIVVPVRFNFEVRRLPKGFWEDTKERLLKRYWAEITHALQTERVVQLISREVDVALRRTEGFGEMVRYGVQLVQERQDLINQANADGVCRATFEAAKVQVQVVGPEIQIQKLGL